MKLNLLDQSKSKTTMPAEDTSKETSSKPVDIKFFKKQESFFSKKCKPLNYVVKPEESLLRIFSEAKNLFLEKLSAMREDLALSREKKSNSFLNFIEKSDFVKNISWIKATKTEESGKVVLSLEVKSEVKTEDSAP